ncbi:MAG: hypothetical protein GKR89_11545 [Candidatus Latescibacteria bacterium]|nr:hypothetical protein [Candidatus Latescibacterota bacterium]
MSTGLPLLEISGPPQERGHQHGEAFREQITTLLEAYFDYFETTSRAHGLKALTKERVLAIAGTYAEPAARYAPDLVQEARGIAQGAGVSYEEILALNAFLDILDYMSDAFARGGCTTLMVPGALDGTGALIAQNYDLPGPFPPAALRHMLTDHVNEPLAICRHDALVHGERCGQTICGIVLEPPTGRAWIAKGPTCENEWVEYGLS